MNQVFEVKSIAQTHALAIDVAKHLRGGEIIELIGDIGVGKTAFTTGLAKALGSDDHVSSPTFKICNTYQAKKFIIHHCDFYRLGSDDNLIKNELAELVAPDSVLVLEWSENLNIDLANSIKIIITVTGEMSRKFDITIADNLDYIKL